ncbi:MAG: hypothetical protein JEZ06_12965 [Anaerolineaceae bacterium]|nr:hypothetical protein [Anaerolineaceae bacterium]
MSSDDGKENITPYEFITQYIADKLILTGKANHELESPEFRADIYTLIHTQPALACKSLLDTLYEKEIQYRRDDSSSDDFFENLYWCAFLLYRIGDVTDVEKMWVAKHINMDTGCGFDIQFLLGAGFQETITYLQTKPFPQSSEVLDYIMTCQKSGDFDDMNEWEYGRYEYFK